MQNHICTINMEPASLVHALRSVCLQNRNVIFSSQGGIES